MKPKDWLSLREMFDGQFRCSELALQFANACGPNRVIVDIGCGTGANFRYLQSYLPSYRKWIGIDKDSSLLRDASVDLPNKLPRAEMELRELDLSQQLATVPHGIEVAVTASAFLDLASEVWLNEFATHFQKCPVLIAMTASGQPIWSPVEKEDRAIQALQRQHQKSDHGFGMASGPDATQYLAELLRDQGRIVTLGDSTWRLDSSDEPLISMMIAGVARRVRSLSTSVEIDSWETRRKAQLQTGELQLSVAHLDLFSLPVDHRAT